MEVTLPVLGTFRIICGKQTGFITTMFRRVPFTKYSSFHVLFGYSTKPRLFIGINHRNYFSILLLFFEFECSYTNYKGIYNDKNN